MNERYYEFYLNWIRREREKQNLSIDDFSCLCNYSKANISKIENYKTQADEEMILSFFKCLNIQFSFNDTQYEVHNQWLEELYQALVFHNLEVAGEKVEIIEKSKESFTQSELFSKYYIYRYAWYTEKRKYAQAQEIQNLLEKHILPFIELNKQEKQIYLDYLGVNLKEQNKYEESVAVLTEALNITDKSITYGMVCYHLGKTYECIGNPIDAVYYERIALTTFTRDLNFKRLLYVQVHIANVYSRMGMYSFANETYLNILKNADLLNNDYLVMTVQGNMNATLMQQENHDKAIENITHAFREKGRVSDLDYFNLVFCYYKLDDYENIKKWMPEIRKAVLTSPSIIREIDILDKVTDMNDNNEVINFLKTEYKQNKVFCSYEERELYLQLLVDYNEKEHKYKVALNYYKMLHH